MKLRSPRERLRAALEPSTFARELAVLVEEARVGRIESVQPVEALPFRGGAWCVLHRLRLRTERGPEKTWAYVRLDEAGPVPGEEVAGESKRIARIGGLLVLFPADLVLETLPAGLDASFVARALRKAGSSGHFRLPAAAARLEATPLRYRPEESCMVRYFLGERVGDSMLRGLLLPGRREVEAASASLARAGEEEVLPLGDLNLILSPEPHGRSFHDALQEALEPQVLERVARRMGAALAGLHVRRGENPTHSPVVLENLERVLAAVEIVCPVQAVAAAPWVVKVAAAIAEAGSATGPPALLHGDLSDHSFVSEGGKVRLTGLHATRWGDPAVEVGDFLSHLTARAHERQGPPLACSPLAGAFLEGYREEAGPIASDPSFEVRHDLWEAAGHLRRACLSLLRPRWQPLFYPLLRESRRVLRRQRRG